MTKLHTTKLQMFALPLAAVLALGLVACEPQNGGTTTTDPAVTTPGVADPTAPPPTDTPEAPVTPETTTP